MECYTAGIKIEEVNSKTTASTRNRGRILSEVIFVLVMQSVLGVCSSNRIRKMKISGKKNKNSTVRFLLIGVLGILAIALICVTLYYVHEVKSARNATAALVAEAQEKYGVELSVADLTTEREAILLSVEDPTFWYHKGVDLVTPGAGMTTISQSLVKLLYFPDGFRPGISKIRQTLIAQYAFDDMVSKDDQPDELS